MNTKSIKNLMSKLKSLCKILNTALLNLELEPVNSEQRFWMCNKCSHFTASPCSSSHLPIMGGKYAQTWNYLFQSLERHGLHCLLAVVEEANWKMSPENSGEVLYKQHAILREKGSTRAQQSWQLHGTESGLCGEEVGTVEFRRDVGQKCLGNVGQHRNAFQCQVQKDNSHCLFRQRAAWWWGAWRMPLCDVLIYRFL